MKAEDAKVLRNVSLNTLARLLCTVAVPALGAFASVAAVGPVPSG